VRNHVIKIHILCLTHIHTHSLSHTHIHVLELACVDVVKVPSLPAQVAALSKHCFQSLGGHNEDVGGLVHENGSVVWCGVVWCGVVWCGGDIG
jgi:DUF1365 family protein